MPQLDKVTFLSQFFWLCFFYIGFYFLILKYFLPKMSRILKLRKNKLSSSQEGVTNLQQENDNIRNTYEGLLANGLNASTTAFNESFQHTEKWLDKMVSNTNQTHYQSMNRTYIQSVGEASLSQNLALSQIAIKLPEIIYLPFLLQKIKSLGQSTNLSLNSLKSKKVGSFTKKLKKQSSNIENAQSFVSVKPMTTTSSNNQKVSKKKSNKK